MRASTLAAWGALLLAAGDGTGRASASADPRPSPPPRSGQAPGRAAPVTIPAAPREEAPPSALGDWDVELGVARVAVRPCGAGLCGDVSWSKDGGEVGTRILRDMAPTGANSWAGTIFDPTTQRSYSARITLSAPDRLRVEGCVLKILCGGQTWTRSK